MYVNQPARASPDVAHWKQKNKQKEQEMEHREEQSFGDFARDLRREAEEALRIVERGFGHDLGLEEYGILVDEDQDLGDAIADLQITLRRKQAERRAQQQAQREASRRRVAQRGAQQRIHRPVQTYSPGIGAEKQQTTDEGLEF